MSTKTAKPDHAIHELLTQRWSPYAFDPSPVAESDLAALFEAARWAASSYNEQPWRYLVARRTNAEAFATLLSCLLETNQAWAKNAPVLVLGLTSHRFARNDKPNKAALHDLGAASAQLSLEATRRGLAVHQMIGIDPERAQAVYSLPDGVEAVTGLAIGHVAAPETLPEALRGRDQAPRTRRPLSEWVFEGSWDRAASWT